ncbi:hypothetical protein ACJW30_05G012400 [Castanea mollissima]
MSVVRDAALSYFLQKLFDKLTSLDLLKIFNQEQFDADVKKWKTTLMKIRAVLDDVEEKQMTCWLDELEDLAYDVEDILDEFVTEALRHELIAEASTSKVLKLIPGCVGLNRNYVTFSGRMRFKIKEIDTRLQEIVTQKNDLELKVKAQGMTKTTRSRLPSTSLVNEGQVFGRDEDKKAIINLLLSGESGDAQLSVIPILGMAGLGKTTLAQLIYNEDNVDNYFDLKAWIHVSEDFDVVRVTKVILQSITCEAYDINDLNLLQVKLKDKLFGKKFLLILDDVWNENYDYWTQLRCPFEFGAPGSKIVVTTRNDRVSSTLGTTKAYKLKGLSNDACLTIFIQHALGTTDFSACPELEEIGQKISERCKGLPSVAKALGGHLSTIHNRDEWKHVLNNKIWNMLEGNNDVLPTLRLSYIYLPSHLKRCFAYCSVFPKDYEFEEKELVLLWMAEGLIQETKENKQIEDLGVEYFRDLIGRSFFQQSSSNESLFVMHDLINDLAQWAAGDLCYRLEDKFGGNKQFKISTKTLILKGCSHLTKLPEKIGNLINLRHLDITNALLIKEMPVGLKELKSLQTLSDFVVGKDTKSKIGDLMNLEFLRGRFCISSLENVPNAEDARNANLNCKKNLDVLVLKWQFDDLQVTRVAVDVLDMLRPPSMVKELFIKGYVGEKFPTWLGDPSFSNMVLLRIENCKNCTSLPAIGQLPSLKDVVIKGMAKVRSIGPEFYGEGCLKPFKSLEKLCFKNMQEWQEWIPHGGEYEFPQLNELTIFRCPKLQGNLPHHLPSLEKFFVRQCKQLFVSIPSFPMLHELEIVGCKKVRSENTIELSSLKSVFFSIPMPNILIEEFMQRLTKIEYLKIYNCKELTTSLWQDRLDSLVMLYIKSCPRLVNISLPSTLRTITIESCHALKSLPISNCTCLEHATIEGCASLTSISRGKLPPSLKRLDVHNCENLLFVVDVREASPSSSLNLIEENLHGNTDNNASFLQHLEIKDCKSLKCLSSSGNLSVMLKHLEIYGCLKLPSLSSRDQLPAALKHISIRLCPMLESIANTLHNNASLEQLKIWHCEKLKTLPEGLHRLCHLNEINIGGCSSLVSFPDRGLLPTNLRKLVIQDCKNLKSLPNHMYILTTLQKLSIWQCPSIMFFHEEGFPTNLTSLNLSSVNIGKQVAKWGLHRLTSLKYLKIYGFSDWQSFPEEGKNMMMLPSSLTGLEIMSFPNLVFLSSKGFQNLSTLKKLLVYDCPKLSFLPEKGLPHSLLKLQIYRCHLLEQHCKKGNGREWFKIANIPCILIDGRAQQRGKTT